MFSSFLVMVVAKSLGICVKDGEHLIEYEFLFSVRHIGHFTACDHTYDVPDLGQSENLITLFMSIDALDSGSTTIHSKSPLTNA